MTFGFRHYFIKTYVALVAAAYHDFARVVPDGGKHGRPRPCFYNMVTIFLYHPGFLKRFRRGLPGWVVVKSQVFKVWEMSNEIRRALIAGILARWTSNHQICDRRFDSNVQLSHSGLLEACANMLSIRIAAVAAPFQETVRRASVPRQRNEGV